MPTLTGFSVRRPAAHEIESIVGPFDLSPLITASAVVYGAFGQPGDVPMGGLLVRPFDGGQSAIFQILVRLEYRRKGIGTRLMSHLLTEARHNNLYALRLWAMVHQDDPFNAFYRKVGLVAERSFATYVMPLGRGVLPITERVAQRYLRRAGAGTQVVSLQDVAPETVARFFADHYGGTFDHRVEQLNQGVYDAALSPAIIKDGELLGAGLFQSRPDNAAIYLDLVLVHPDHRNGPLGQVMLDAMARRGIARGFSELVFEADAQHDASATGFARRASLMPQWYRHRYAMSVTMRPASVRSA